MDYLYELNAPPEMSKDTIAMDTSNELFLDADLDSSFENQSDLISNMTDTNEMY